MTITGNPLANAWTSGLVRVSVKEGDDMGGIEDQGWHAQARAYKTRYSLCPNPAPIRKRSFATLRDETFLTKRRFPGTWNKDWRAGP
jgi:hypothetical protein